MPGSSQNIVYPNSVSVDYHLPKQFTHLHCDAEASSSRNGRDHVFPLGKKLHHVSKLNIHHAIIPRSFYDMTTLLQNNTFAFIVYFQNDSFKDVLGNYNASHVDVVAYYSFTTALTPQGSK